MNKVKIGIIGIGNMGSAHCKTFVDGKIENAELVAVADLRSDRRQWAKENLPVNVHIYENDEELIKSDVCDAVMVAVPHYQHPGITIKALQSGLHVLCEKPAGVYTKQVKEMNEVAKKTDKVFALMFNQRTNSCYRKMHELVQSGELGDIKRVNWIITDWYRTQYYYDSGSWRGTWYGEGGGVLLNQCPHQLDLLQWICGMPNKVMAYCHEGKWHDIEVEDDVTAYFEYPNGATGVFVTSTGDAPGTNRFEIDLTRGRMVCENGVLSCYRMEDERKYMFTATDGFSMPKGEAFDPLLDGKNPEHPGVIQAFVNRILHGTELVADGIEGIKSVSLTNAIQLSGWLGQEVTIPVDDDIFLEHLNKKRSTSRKKTNVHEVTLSTEGTYGTIR